MKNEARFQIRGRVARAYDKVVAQKQVVALIVKVESGVVHEFEADVWEDELKDVARCCQGRQALILGRLRCVRNEHGYLNPRLSVEALLVEPESPRAYGASVPAVESEARALPQGGVQMPHEEDGDIPF